MNLRYRILFVLTVVVSLSGCASYQHRSQMTDFNTAYGQGDYRTALQSMAFEVSEGQPVDQEGRLLELLHQAELYRLNGDFEQSAATYDLAEEGMKYLDTESLAEEAGEGFMAVMINDSQRDYKALMSEAILVNTYKALAFLAAGNNDYARIELNRADDRTRRAVEYFEKEIAAQQAALEEEARAENGDESALFAQQSLSSDAVQQAVADNYGAPSGWSVFPEFIVPTSTYLHGIYLLANGAISSDFAGAETSLKRVAEMNPGSGLLGQDAELAEALASGKTNIDDLRPQVWVLYENGLGPILEETRFDVPLLLFHGNQQAPAYTGIALPRYADREPVPGSLKVSTSAGDALETKWISDMGTVIRTEMKSRFPGVLARAVASAVVKAVIQNEATEQFGVWGQLGAAALTVATTQADLRGWQAMPDHWQAARLDRPADSVLTLSESDGQVLGTVQIPDQKFTLLYVKRPTSSAPATVMIIDLQGSAPAQLAQLPEAAPTAAEQQISSVE